MSSSPTSSDMPRSEKTPGVANTRSDDALEEEQADDASIPGLKTTTVPPWRFWLLSVGVCLGLFLSMLDSSIVATSLYTMGVDFKSVHSINWVALAYTLSYLSCAVAFARLSDVIGRRNAFVASYILFLAFSLACGFAQNLTQLIIFRAFQGIGGSGLYSLTMIILNELCPRELLQHLGSIIGMVIAGAGVLGPVLGGILTQYASWRWVFWINGPIGLVSMTIFFLSWPKAEYLPDTQRRSWREFDFFGSLLVIAAAVLVVFAFQNAGESSDVWGSAIFITPLVVGIICWVALFAWEHAIDRWFRDRLAPAFPISLFRNRFYTSGAVCTMLIGYPYLLLVFSFPTRAQVVSGKSALVAGLMLLPMLATTALGSMISGKLNTMKNCLFETMLCGACLMALGCGLLTTVSGSGDDAKALGFLIFAGLGFGLSTAAATILVGVEAPIREYAPAHGILAQMRILGGSLGISTSTVFLQTEVVKRLTGVLTPQEMASLGGGVTHLYPEKLEAVQLAYSNTFQKGMVAAVVVAGVAVLLTFGGFRCGRMDLKQQRQALIQEEIEWRRGQSPVAKKPTTSQPNA